MLKRRVVVTGMGAICSLGVNVPEIWKNALAGKANVCATPSHWGIFNKFNSKIWTPLPEIDYMARGIPKVEVMRTDPVTLNQSVTVQEALVNAGIEVTKREGSHEYDITGIDTSRMGVFMGTAVGGVNSIFKNHTNMLLHKNSPQLKNILSEDEQDELDLHNWQYPKRLNPFIVPMFMPNAISAFVAIKYGIKGPNITTALACAAGTAAIGMAYKAITEGSVDIAISGGSEYLNDEYGAAFKGFDAAGTLTTTNDEPLKANRPFDAKRNGFLFSEGGAATLVLEEYEAAIARGANIIGEIKGYGESFDAFNIMRPDPSGEVAGVAIQNAVTDAGLHTNDIGYINTHGTGTVANDETEASIIEKHFGNQPLVTATKSLTGHAIGASGALEAVISLLSLQHGKSHAIQNLQNPIADLNFCTTTQKMNAQFGISQSFAFGGHNIALVMAK